MNTNIKLVVADIDMTLKSTFEEKLPPINVKAIKDLHANGYMFGLASGRSINQILESYSKWGFCFDVDMCIGVNGSVLYDGLTKQKDVYLTFKYEWVKEISELLDDNGINYYFYIDDYTIFRKPDEHFYILLKNMTRDVRLANSVNDFLVGNVYKLLFITNEEQNIEYIKKVISPFLSKHKKELKLLMTTKDCLELVHYETSKAFALKKFCDRHNLSLKNVAAFGDADNDNEMIQISNMGVALKDGVESTRKIANYITYLNCDEGGFGDFVYKHILNESKGE